MSGTMRMSLGSPLAQRETMTPRVEWGISDFAIINKANRHDIKRRGGGVTH